MGEWKVPVQSLIDHIKTAHDVDPWAKEMAEELLKEQEAKPQRYNEHDIFHLPTCPNENCYALVKKGWHYCPYCKQPIQWDDDLDKRVNM